MPYATIRELCDKLQNDINESLMDAEKQARRFILRWRLKTTAEALRNIRHPERMLTKEWIRVE